MPTPDSALAEQFDDLEQQEEAATLGMWAFLATEVLFFGGMFLAYAVYRITSPAEFARASREFNVTLGTLNTAILLTSSLTMALAVHTARLGKRRQTFAGLVLTAILGVGFLVVKGFEYADDFARQLFPTPGNPGRMLYYLYYSMTGLHAVHLSIGIGVVFWIGVRTARGEFSQRYSAPIEVTGLYWHFVDLVWVFLYPLLYLIDRHG